MKKWISLTMVVLAAGIAFQLSAKEQGEAAGVGSSAPAFTLKDQDGHTVSLSDYRGKVVVLEWWNEGCPYCARHAREGTMKNIAQQYKSKDVVFLAVNSTDGSSTASNKKVHGQYALNYPILDDFAGSVGRAYGAKTTPHMFIIDRGGKIAYSGAIDDDPEAASDKDINYVTKALDEILAGSTVATPETKPYGCGVKYKK